MFVGVALCQARSDALLHALLKLFLLHDSATGRSITVDGVAMLNADGATFVHVVTTLNNTDDVDCTALSPEINCISNCLQQALQCSSLLAALV